MLTLCAMNVKTCISSAAAGIAEQLSYLGDSYQDGLALTHMPDCLRHGQKGCACPTLQMLQPLLMLLPGLWKLVFSPAITIFNPYEPGQWSLMLRIVE